MKVNYDQETDTLTITLRDARIRESDEVRPGVIADYDDVGQVVGFEVLSASKVMEEFALSGFGAAAMSNLLREEPPVYAAKVE